MDEPNDLKGSRLPDRLDAAELPDGASVKVIGAGGVGGIVFRYLAVFLAALGRPLRLFAMDGDRFEAGNATRMLFRSFGNKAQVLVDELSPHFFGSNLGLFAVPEFLHPENIGRLVREGDWLVLALDNHASRRLLSDHCSRLSDVVLVSAGNDGVGIEGGVSRRGTYANVQVYVRRAGRDLTPPLTRWHPEIAEPADRLPTEPHCTDLVGSVPQILFTNLAAASVALNAFLLLASRGADEQTGLGALHYSELGVDIAEGLMRPMLPVPSGPSGLQGTEVVG